MCCKQVRAGLFLGAAGVVGSLLLLSVAQSSAALAAARPLARQDGTATAAALLTMQHSIFATQTAIALTEQPPTATPPPTHTARPPTSTPRPTSTARAVHTATSAATPTAALTNTLRPTSTPAPTATARPASTATSPSRTGTASAAVSLPTATPRPEEPLVEVLESDINLRAGPGTGFPIIGSAARGTRYPVTGQAADCGWLQIRRAGGEQVWITGAPAYTRLNVLCSSVPAAVAQAAPTAAATNTPVPARPAAAAATPPPPTATPAPANSGPGAMAALSPPPDAALSGPVTFSWTPDAPLAPGQVFELVFWQPGESAAQGRALNSAAPVTAMTINVNNLAAGQHQWGVFLAQAEPYQRIRFLGQGETINVTGGGAGGDGGGSDNGSDSGGEPDNGGMPPEPGGKE